MPVVTASQFARSFGKYQDEAFGETVKVTSHGRVIGAYISAAELDHFERLKRRESEVLIAGQLPDDAVEAIEAAQYGVGPA